jgi:hypothetical protein
MQPHSLKPIFGLSLFLIPSVAGAQQSLPDSKVRHAFIKECTTLVRAVPDLSLPCSDFAKGKPAAVVRQYLSLVRAAKTALMSAGPQIAQEMLKSCLGNAATKNSDPGELLFCIRLKKQGNDLVKLAKGQGSLKEYGKMAQASTEPVPAYPTDNSPQAEAQRAEVRKDLVYGCAEQETGYIQALCGAVAVNEIFASRPFGDNGELAKAFDKVVQIYAVTEAPRIVIQGEVKELLQRAGLNDQVATAISNPQEGAIEGGKHLVSEGQKLVNKIIPKLELPKIDLNPFPH